MNVYLAGKMDEKHGAWRNAVMSGFYRDAWITRTWPLDNDEGVLDGGVHDWESLPSAVFERHAYVGPFRQEMDEVGIKSLGYFHGVWAFGQHGCMAVTDEARVVRFCKQAIQQADLIFCYINTPDAYGTLAEIGYAVALGKFVSLLVHPSACWERDDYWFIRSLVVHAPDYPLRVNDAWTDYEPELNEWQAIRNALKDAFVSYAAWVPPARDSRGDLTALAVSEAQRSFCDIAQWTSDPRVRGEAQRMAQILAGRGRR